MYTHTAARLSVALAATLLLIGCGGAKAEDEAAAVTVTLTGAPAATDEMAPGTVTKEITVKSSDGSDLTIALAGASAGKGVFKTSTLSTATWSDTVTVKSGWSFYYRAPGMGGTFTVNATTGKTTVPTAIKVKESQVVGTMPSAPSGSYYEGLTGHFRAADVQLPSGKVLVFGGYKHSSSTFSSAIIEYDPMSNQGFGGSATKTATLAQGRCNFTATLLANGKVLICGGQTGLSSAVTAGAELYDPATGTLEPLPNMGSARTLHTAALLANGKVLIAGGENGENSADYGSKSVATAELFDPATKTFSATGSLADARSRHTATVLPNGKVLIAGGWKATNYSTMPLLATAEVYDPATGGFIATGSLAAAKYQHSAILLPNGKVLIAGGRLSDSSSTAVTEIFDPATGSFAPGPNMGTARRHLGIAQLNDKVYFVGGLNGVNPVPSIEEYDPATNAISTKAQLDSNLGIAAPWLCSHGPINGDYPKGRLLMFFTYSISLDYGVRSYLP